MSIIPKIFDDGCSVFIRRRTDKEDGAFWIQVPDLFLGLENMDSCKPARLPRNSSDINTHSETYLLHCRSVIPSQISLSINYHS